MFRLSKLSVSRASQQQRHCDPHTNPGTSQLWHLDTDSLAIIVQDLDATALRVLFGTSQWCRQLVLQHVQCVHLKPLCPVPRLPVLAALLHYERFRTVPGFTGLHLIATSTLNSDPEAAPTLLRQVQAAQDGRVTHLVLQGLSIDCLYSQPYVHKRPSLLASLACWRSTAFKAQSRTQSEVQRKRALTQAAASLAQACSGVRHLSLHGVKLYGATFLQQLSVSCTQLEHLTLGRFDWEDLEAKKSIRHLATGLPALQQLDLLHEPPHTLQSFPYLLQRITTCVIDQQPVWTHILQHHVAHLQNLRHLTISHQLITLDTAEPLLALCKPLLSLSLSACTIQCASFLPRLATSCFQLQQLGLHRLTLDGPATWQGLGPLSKGLPALQGLSVSHLPSACITQHPAVLERVTRCEVSVGWDPCDIDPESEQQQANSQSWLTSLQEHPSMYSRLQHLVFSGEDMQWGLFTGLLHHSPQLASLAVSALLPPADDSLGDRDSISDTAAGTLAGLTLLLQSTCVTYLCRLPVLKLVKHTQLLGLQLDRLRGELQAGVWHASPDSMFLERVANTAAAVGTMRRVSGLIWIAGWPSKEALCAATAQALAPLAHHLGPVLQLSMKQGTHMTVAMACALGSSLGEHVWALEVSGIILDRAQGPAWAAVCEAFPRLQRLLLMPDAADVMGGAEEVQQAVAASCQAMGRRVALTVAGGRR